MVRQLDAIYEDGVLRPLEPLALTEHQRVRLTFDDESLPQLAAGIDRRAEMLWLASEGRYFRGQWVALNGSSLVAHGTDARTVRAAARAAGIERPLLTHLPQDAESPFGGW